MYILRNNCFLLRNNKNVITSNDSLRNKISSFSNRRTIGRAKCARKRFRMLFTENVYGVYLEESKRLKLGLYIETLKELPV